MRLDLGLCPPCRQFGGQMQFELDLPSLSLICVDMGEARARFGWRVAWRGGRWRGLGIRASARSSFLPLSWPAPRPPLRRCRRASIPSPSEPLQTYPVHLRPELFSLPAEDTAPDPSA
uniref:Uncharacterized protein n=1 Tax=Setaria viridis TaxID=4556 RepID=A0A4U6VE63_SETVI|nr:hypothetical protein SEVIR_3G124600v2 [Setaria viridis]